MIISPLTGFLGKEDAGCEVGSDSGNESVGEYFDKVVILIL